MNTRVRFRNAGLTQQGGVIDHDALQALARFPAVVDRSLVRRIERHSLFRQPMRLIDQFLRPFDDLSGFDTETLAVEDQALILPAGHALSGRASITVAEARSISGLPLPRWPELDGSYLGWLAVTGNEPVASPVA